MTIKILYVTPPRMMAQYRNIRSLFMDENGIRLYSDEQEEPIIVKGFIMAVYQKKEPHNAPKSA